MFGQPQLRMKILCPNCSEVVKLNDLQDRGEQSECCSKCKAVIYATYEETSGGRKVWKIHFEKPPEAKKKEPPPKDGCLWLILLILAVIMAVALYRAWGDLNIININGP
jgi:hypothetical protein